MSNLTYLCIRPLPSPLYLTKSSDEGSRRVFAVTYPRLALCNQHMEEDEAQVMYEFMDMENSGSLLLEDTPTIHERLDVSLGLDGIDVVRSGDVRGIAAAMKSFHDGWLEAWQNSTTADADRRGWTEASPAMLGDPRAQEFQHATELDWRVMDMHIADTQGLRKLVPREIHWPVPTADFAASCLPADDVIVRVSGASGEPCEIRFRPTLYGSANPIRPAVVARAPVQADADEGEALQGLASDAAGWSTSSQNWHAGFQVLTKGLTDISEAYGREKALSQKLTLRNDYQGLEDSLGTWRPGTDLLPLADSKRMSLKSAIQAAVTQLADDVS